MKRFLLLTLTTGLIFITATSSMTQENNYTQKDAIEEAMVDVEQLNNKLDNFLKEKNLNRFKLNWKDEPPYILFYNSEDKEKIKKYHFVVIGTYSPQKGTWQWGWDNPSYSKSMRYKSFAQRDVGKYLQLEELYTTEGSFELHPDDAWKLGTFSVKYFGGEALYVTRDGENIEGNPLETYLLLLDPSKQL
tara:strand:+ start:42 stop:611 length:570 start_codon:yes stop_codon:yes gene_type:complete